MRPGGPRQVGRRVRGDPGTPERRDAVVIRTKEAGGGWCGTLGWQGGLRPVVFDLLICKSGKKQREF